MAQCGGGGPLLCQWCQAATSAGFTANWYFISKCCIFLRTAIIDSLQPFPYEDLHPHSPVHQTLRFSPGTVRRRRRLITDEAHSPRRLLCQKINSFAHLLCDLMRICILSPQIDEPDGSPLGCAVVEEYSVSQTKRVSLGPLCHNVPLKGNWLTH